MRRLLNSFERYYFLQPGQIIITREPVPIVTILGSCVAVTIHSPGTGLTGVFHALLPEHSIKKNLISGQPPISPNAEYVDFAFYYLKHRFLESGVNLKNTRMMLFGGSDVLKMLDTHKSVTVGARNINMARSIIKREEMAFHREDTGGINGRRLVFMPGDGRAYVQYLGNSAVPRGKGL